VARFSLSAVGRDRPGIVAAVTGVLAEHGGNLQDSTMATLQGQFAIVLIVAAPDGVDAETLQGDLQGVADTFDLVVAVRALHEDLPSAGGEPVAGAGVGESGTRAWSVTVHGADRPGIVHGITAALAELDGNIVDLATHLVGEHGRPVYTLTIRATVPAATSDALPEHLGRAAAALGVHCTARPDDADVL
jgi:glycine cleavage system transcriptional repressor